MKPELINRLDGIIVFHPLTQENVEKIFDNLLEELRKRLATKKLGLKITPEVKQELIREGYDPKNGARPLRRVMEDKLEAMIAEHLLAGEVQAGDMIEIGRPKGKKALQFKVVQE